MGLKSPCGTADEFVLRMVCERASPVKVGLCGIAKSGNYLLFKTIRELQLASGNWSSYVEAKEIFSPSNYSLDVPPTFPEMFIYDFVAVLDGGLYLQAYYLVNGEGPKSVPVPDVDEFVKLSSCTWVHQEPCAEHFELLGDERMWVYVLRDGRDVVNSQIHWTTNPFVRQITPEYRLTDVREIYSLPGYFEKRTRQWAEHVRAFLKLQDSYLLVRYEDLVRDKSAEIARLASYMGIGVDELDIAAIAERTSPSSTRKTAGGHVRKARMGDWQRYFQKEHKDAFKRIAGDLLIELGYESDLDW